MTLQIFCPELYLAGGGLYPSIPFAIKSLAQKICANGTFKFEVRVYEEPIQEDLYDTTFFDVVLVDGSVTSIVECPR